MQIQQPQIETKEESSAVIKSCVKMGRFKLH